jgi:hypothetical protein
VCVAALVLRKRSVKHDHYTAPTALLVIGVVGNAALLVYTAVTSPKSLLYCGGMLAVGAVLYFVNNLFTSDDSPIVDDDGLEG